MDRAEHVFELWRKYGYVMFPQQRSIYGHIARVIRGRDVIEAGCGDGIGSAILEREAARFLATDLPDNLAFARALHPWLEVSAWDIYQPLSHQADVVVAVEVIEHVQDDLHAIANLLAAARCELWLSTPNGRLPSDNPHHVREYTPAEMVVALGGAEVLHWQTFEPVPLDTDVTPVVYRKVK